jgi:hypothetical protein
MNSVVVRADGRRLIVQVRPNDGNAQPEMAVSFYGQDRVVVMEGPDKGQSIEFIRGPDNRVNWIRVVGRIAVRSASASP